MRALILIAVLALVGCAAPTQIETKEVDVTIPVSCDKAIVNLPPPPKYVDTPAALSAAKDILDRVKLLVAGRIQREHREAELNAVLLACLTEHNAPSEVPAPTSPSVKSGWLDKVFGPKKP